MSSNGLFKDGSLDLGQSRRSTRERKQPQYFGYSGSDSQAEELVSRSLNHSLFLMPMALAFLRSFPIKVEDGRTIAHSTDGGKERAPVTPSLIIKLSLPAINEHEHEMPLSPCGEAVKPDKKRGFGFLSEEGSENSTPTSTVRYTTKRQRLSLANSTQPNKDPLRPRGQPEVWAEVSHI